MTQLRQLAAATNVIDMNLILQNKQKMQKLTAIETCLSSQEILDKITKDAFYASTVAVSVGNSYYSRGIFGSFAST